jgi:hypothetical protein
MGVLSLEESFRPNRNYERNVSVKREIKKKDGTKNRETFRIKVNNFQLRQSRNLKS